VPSKTECVVAIYIHLHLIQWDSWTSAYRKYWPQLLHDYNGVAELVHMMFLRFRGRLINWSYALSVQFINYVCGTETQCLTTCFQM
jgi:hypothetical protein